MPGKFSKGKSKSTQKVRQSDPRGAKISRLWPTERSDSETRQLLLKMTTIERLRKEHKLDLLYVRMEEMGLVPIAKWKSMLIQPVGYWARLDPELKAKGYGLEIYGPAYAIWNLVDEFREDAETKHEDVIH